jgi:hypothetical protein
MGMQALQSAAAPAGELVRDHRWFPEDFHAPRQMLSFVFAEREVLAREPFLDQRWQQEKLERRQARIDDLDVQMPAGSRPPIDFLWHTSFCCSTLLAHALDEPGKCLALSEPLVLVSIADAKRTGLIEQGWHLSRLPEIVLRLLARPEAPGARVLVKPSNFANVLLGDAARLTSGKSLFLYSSLNDFLVSVLKSGFPLRKYVRRLFSNLIGPLRDQLPWQQAEIFQMSDLEIAALAWHLQILEFRSAWRLLGPARAASLDCEALLADPATALRKVIAFYGLPFGDVKLHALLSGGALHHHSKAPGIRFDAQRRREEAAAVLRAYGDDVARVVEWSYRACPLTPQGAPLPQPLVAPPAT